MSLGGVTEDETTTDPQVARRKLRQRAEISRGRSDESPRYDKHNFKNGQANGRFRGREFSEASDYNEWDQRTGNGKHTHANGGYKYSDESHQQTETESEDDDVKKELEDSEEEEDDRRNSFTPVKFKPNVEKELDSIQITGNGSIQYLKQDDTGSVDLGGRNLSRSMSSFSAHDVQAENYSSRSDSKNSMVNVPTPPPPLPLNIPAKQNTPTRPKPRPVPAPRPKPLPSARSYGSRENISDTQEVKLNNLSQDEASDYRGSRERLDDMRYPPPRGDPGRENRSQAPGLDQYRSRSREKLNDPPETHQRFPSADTSEGRNSPMLHGSRENLLPKRTDGDSHRPNYEPLQRPGERFQPNPYEPSQPYAHQGAAPGVDYMPRSDYSDGNPGVDYLPKNTGMPMKNRHMIGYQQTPSSSDYESYDGGYQPSPRLADTTPGHYDYNPQSQTQYPPYSYGNNSQNVPYSPADVSNIDYLPRSDGLSTPRSYQNMSRSRENLSRSRENLGRSRENITRSRENLYNDIRENSMDVVKPRQQKSIETEI